MKQITAETVLQKHYSSQHENIDSYFHPRDIETILAAMEEYRSLPPVDVMEVALIEELTEDAHTFAINSKNKDCSVYGAYIFGAKKAVQRLTGKKFLEIAIENQQREFIQVDTSTNAKMNRNIKKPKP